MAPSDYRIDETISKYMPDGIKANQMMLFPDRSTGQKTLPMVYGRYAGGEDDETGPTFEETLEEGLKFKQPPWYVARTDWPEEDTRFEDVQAWNPHCTDLGKFIIKANKLQWLSSFEAGAVLRIIARGMAPLFHIYEWPLTIHATNDNKDSTNTAFRKDVRYERPSFDFYVETGGSRFAGGLANFVSTDAPGGFHWGAYIWDWKSRIIYIFDSGRSGRVQRAKRLVKSWFLLLSEHWLLDHMDYILVGSSEQEYGWECGYLALTALQHWVRGHVGLPPSEVVKLGKVPKDTWIEAYHPINLCNFTMNQEMVGVSRFEDVQAWNPHCTDLGKFIIKANKLQWLSSFEAGAVLRIIARGMAPLFHIYEWPLTIHATNDNKDSTNTAFRKDVRGFHWGAYIWDWKSRIIYIFDSGRSGRVQRAKRLVKSWFLLLSEHWLLDHMDYILVGSSEQEYGWECGYLALTALQHWVRGHVGLPPSEVVRLGKVPKVAAKWFGPPMAAPPEGELLLRDWPIRRLDDEVVDYDELLQTTVASLCEMAANELGMEGDHLIKGMAIRFPFRQWKWTKHKEIAPSETLTTLGGPSPSRFTWNYRTARWCRVITEASFLRGNITRITLPEEDFFATVEMSDAESQNESDLFSVNEEDEEYMDIAWRVDQLQAIADAALAIGEDPPAEYIEASNALAQLEARMDEDERAAEMAYRARRRIQPTCLWRPPAFGCHEVRLRGWSPVRGEFTHVTAVTNRPTKGHVGWPQRAQVDYDPEEGLIISRREDWSRVTTRRDEWLRTSPPAALDDTDNPLGHEDAERIEAGDDEAFDQDSNEGQEPLGMDYSRSTRDSASPLPSSNRDEDPILNPRESSSELSDPFVGSPTDPFAEVPSPTLRALQLSSELSDFSIDTPSDLLFDNSEGDEAAKKIAAEERKTTTKKIVVARKHTKPVKKITGEVDLNTPTKSGAQSQPQLYTPVPPQPVLQEPDSILRRGTRERRPTKRAFDQPETPRQTPSKKAKTPVVTPKAIAPQRTPMMNLVDYSDFEGTTVEQLGREEVVLDPFDQAVRGIEPHTNHTVWTKDCQPSEKGAGDKLGVAGAIMAYTGRALARLELRQSRQIPHSLRSDSFVSLQPPGLMSREVWPEIHSAVREHLIAYHGSQGTRLSRAERAAKRDSNRS
ncbi:hypothetical protein L249_0754 [Ophiocordyceps polyrhachis-furcata BCC 54312]|uniref:Uncharacterized protein n=1 Tax=Ophiocordyceps polyrhachis-furcata BCC 54312 TaxID=1330021 RepID=A0A367LCH0_9HYPO|nr:hypothetical protein L249_0754 [Ophiocordyceps polyrhachis-furcata BCC 54312]